MTDINKLKDDGFRLTDQGDKLLSLALLSLKIALKAYFSTYQSMASSLHLFDPKNTQEQITVDLNHGILYWEAYAETVVHFQHFAELVCKDFLRVDHPLLADVASNDPIIFHKLLRRELLSPDDERGLKSIEFSEALDRLSKLVKERRISDRNLNIVEQVKWLKQLNYLRNQVWHRGTFILRYPALDKLVGEFVLPFVKQVTTLPEYSNQERFWKYEKLTCNIDPIESIVDEFKGGNYNLGKVAFLKELGRAAYENPSDMFEPFFGYKRRARHIAETERIGVDSVKICPVCGVESLVVYRDIETVDEDPEDGTYKEAWEFTYEVKCMCCTFEINYHLENPSSYNLPIEDYWYEKQL